MKYMIPHPQNILYPFESTRPKWKLEIEKSMTLIVGIVCKDGLVIAADSQTVKGDYKYKDANKIAVIDFPDGNQAVVAGSGVVPLINRTIDILKKKATAVESISDESISELTAESLRDVMRTHPPFGQGIEFSPSDTQAFWEKGINYFELMVASCVSKPTVNTMSPYSCAPSKPKVFFETSGVGDQLGEYLLKQYASPQMELDFGAVMAIYVTEQVNSTIKDCDGNARVALVRSSRRNLYPESEPAHSEVKLLADRYIQELYDIIQSVEQESQIGRKAQLEMKLRERSERLMKEFINPKDPNTLY